ncbi:class I SAM-dependent methyltransferase [Fontivita pretiosa]|uniref:class I SAM-dependent methyltransferase n=1 Tax=Fontivita pretiosa TaxID=2989684 RepID=UPI003D1642BA
MSSTALAVSDASSRAAGSRAIQLHRPQPVRDVPYVPSDEKVVEAMLELAGVNEKDVVYDLGCGDGRIVLAAARRGARGVGVDIDLQRIHEAQDNARRAGLTARVSFLRASFFDVDLRDATVVTLYLLPGINIRLRPKLLFELRPGARVISNNFDMKEWSADEQLVIYHRTLYKWIIPAWVQGTWSCYISRSNGRRRHMVLELQRRFQRVSGSAQLNGQRVYLVEGRIEADRLSFALWHPQHLLPAIRFRCTVEGDQLRGTCHADSPGADATTWAWGGVRRS